MTSEVVTNGVEPVSLDAIVFDADTQIRAAISEFTDSKARLAHDLAAVRELLRLALQQLHETGRQHDCLSNQHRRLSDEYRALRATILSADKRPA